MSLNRSLLNGESLFTSMGVLNGKIPGKKWHLDRLFNSVNDYFFKGRLDRKQFLKYFDLEELKYEGNGYLRLTFYSKVPVGAQGIGLCDLVFKKSWQALPVPRSQLVLALAQSPYSSQVSGVKAGSYFESFNLRSKYREDDVILLRDDLVLEATTSCLILEKDGEFFTPCFEGGLESISLKLMKNFLEERKKSLNKIEIKKNGLSDFSSAFLINSVQYLQTVSRIEDTEFTINSNLVEEFRKFLEQK